MGDVVLGSLILVAGVGFMPAPPRTAGVLFGEDILVDTERIDTFDIFL